MISKPADPTLTGYAFAGWYTDKNCTNAYDFRSKVTGNISLYAKWNIAYTVSFDSNGGSSIANQSVESNHTASKPANPSKTGFTFAGWFTDKDCTTAYDFSSKVTGDITLYAKW
ncbi:MAG TPA: cell surface glycoprotein, partial [Roseburia sp.]|nr:cell surface glycoprotein [Roseburia sp.]